MLLNRTDLLGRRLRGTPAPQTPGPAAIPPTLPGRAELSSSPSAQGTDGLDGAAIPTLTAVWLAASCLYAQVAVGFAPALELAAMFESGRVLQQVARS